MHVATRGSAPTITSAYLTGLIRGRRAARSDTARQAAAQGLCDRFLELPWARAARTVALYESEPEEPGTEILRGTLVARGVTVVSLWAAPWTDPDVFVLPALAVDTRGRRLADRSDPFEQLLGSLPPAAPALAAVFDDEIYDVALGSLPGARRDHVLAGALTPTRILPFTPDHR